MPITKDADGKETTRKKDNESVSASGKEKTYVETGQISPLLRAVDAGEGKEYRRLASLGKELEAKNWQSWAPTS
ncbi:MAG: hypothetical protein U5L11_00770 [Arhodomonas sp.]|nr:hypothetical protein [Arhodomonas sp.]